MLSAAIDAALRLLGGEGAFDHRPRVGSGVCCGACGHGLFDGVVGRVGVFGGELQDRGSDEGSPVLAGLFLVEGVGPLPSEVPPGGE